MKKTLAVLTGLGAVVAAGPVLAAPIAAGDIVIYRVGSGSALTSGAASQVFLDEYSAAGSLVQSIAMPTSLSGGNHMLTASSTATSEGLLTTSADGRYVLLSGYDAAVGTAGVSGTTGTAVKRTVGLVDLNGNVDTSTALTDFSSGNNPRSVVSTNGTDLWVVGGAGGIRYTTTGSGTSTQISTTLTNLRQLEIFNGQLYTSTSSGTSVRIGTVGTGTPTVAGQSITTLAGLPVSTGSPYAFYMADLTSAVAGVDTLYVADDAAGISKYSLVGGTWVGNGTIGTGADAYRGLTGSVSGSGVSLFATRKGGSTTAGGGELVSFQDLSGYNGALSGSLNVLATAAANTSFRGLAMIASVPEPRTWLMMVLGLAIATVAARRRA